MRGGVNLLRQLNVRRDRKHVGDYLGHVVLRTFTTLWRLPVDILSRHLDVAGLAVDAAVIRVSKGINQRVTALLTFAR